MSLFDGLDAEALEDLSYELADLKHDLGKYMTLEVRFLGEGPDTEALRAALRADLLETDKRAGAVQPAWAVWARLKPSRLDDPDLAEVDAAIAALRDTALDGLDHAGLQAVAGQARAVQAALKRVHARCLAALDEGDD